MKTIKLLSHKTLPTLHIMTEAIWDNQKVEWFSTKIYFNRLSQVHLIWSKQNIEDGENAQRQQCYTETRSNTRCNKSGWPKMKSWNFKARNTWWIQYHFSWENFTTPFINDELYSIDNHTSTEAVYSSCLQTILYSSMSFLVHACLLSRLCINHCLNLELPLMLSTSCFLN